MSFFPANPVNADTAVLDGVTYEYSADINAWKRLTRVSASDVVGLTTYLSTVSGWSPVLAVVSDGERRVHQVIDWTGGTGTKPAAGSYIGVTGLVATTAAAVDVRGAAGPTTAGAIVTALTGAPELPQVQSLVSEGPFVPLQRYASHVVDGDWAPALAQLFADYGTTTGAKVLMPRGVTVLRSWPTIPVTNDAAPRQVPFALVGSGAHMTGRNEISTIFGGTTLDLQFAAPYGKILTLGLGLLVLEDLTITDLTAQSGALLYTTNTTLMASRVSWMGTLSGSSAIQDAIILGGVEQIEGAGGVTHGFQGYGTVIDSCYFGKIRRCVYGRAFANGIKVVNNTVWGTCGGGSGIAAIEFDGRPNGVGSQYCAGNTIAGNLIEIAGYEWGVRLKRAIQNDVIGNTFFDAVEAHSLAAVRIESDSTGNRCANSYTSPTIVGVDDQSPGQRNTVYDIGSRVSRQGATVFFDDVTATEIKKAKFTGGNEGLVIQAETPQGNNGILMAMRRSVAETVEPGLDVFTCFNDGRVYFRKAQFKDDGNTWLNSTKDGGGNIVGGPMYMDTGPGGSYFDLRAYGVRFTSHVNTLMCRIGAGKLGLSYGPALDASWERHASAPIMIGNTPIRSGEYTAATLPTPSATYRGARAHITDAPAAPAYMSTVSGGGSSTLPVMCTGSSWIFC